MERATTQTPVHMTRLTAAIVAVIGIAMEYATTTIYVRMIALIPAATPTVVTTITMGCAIIQTVVRMTRPTAV